MFLVWSVPTSTIKNLCRTRPIRAISSSAMAYNDGSASTSKYRVPSSLSTTTPLPLGYRGSLSISTKIHDSRPSYSDTSLSRSSSRMATGVSFERVGSKNKNDGGAQKGEPQTGPSGEQKGQKAEEEIVMLKPNGWKLVKLNLARVVEYGRREGLLNGDSGNAGQNDAGGQNDDNDNMEKHEKQDEDVVKIETRDLSMIHAAIPFLPVPVAVFCFFLNIVLPGSGTVVSGFCNICMGQPRINFKEGRRFMTLVVNFLVGIAQLGTITFLLVGWFWSMAWGGLLLTHSLQYREALMQHRQEAVATAAIEALTRDAILRRRDVRTLVQERKNEVGAAAAAGTERRRSQTVFKKFGKGAKNGSVKQNGVS